MLLAKKKLPLQPFSSPSSMHHMPDVTSLRWNQPVTADVERLLPPPLLHNPRAVPQHVDSLLPEVLEMHLTEFRLHHPLDEAVEGFYTLREAGGYPQASFHAECFRTLLDVGGRPPGPPDGKCRHGHGGITKPQCDLVDHHRRKPGDGDCHCR